MAPTYDRAEAEGHAVFAALMAALARPGSRQDLPGPGLGQFIATLIDRDTTVHSALPDLAGALTQVRARLAPIETAEHVFLPDSAALAPALGKVAVGSPFYPHLGATVLLPCTLSDGADLRLTGPGIPGSLRVNPRIPPEVWAIRAARASYPAGVELVLIGAGQVMAIPRSTEVEVL